MAKFLDRLADAVERATWLDRPADAIAGALRRLLPTGVVKDVASGAPIGQPVHPLLVGLPIGSCWLPPTSTPPADRRSG
jgi:hypothetical protein